jgi:hypothetical protein
MKTFNYYQDSGHGWAKVPIKLLEELNIENKITLYSYMRGKYAYLEEDGDLVIFFNAFNRLRGFDPKLKSFHTDRSSKIRSYEPYYYKPFIHFFVSEKTIEFKIKNSSGSDPHGGNIKEIKEIICNHYKRLNCGSYQITFK